LGKLRRGEKNLTPDSTEEATSGEREKKDKEGETVRLDTGERK